VWIFGGQIYKKARSRGWGMADLPHRNQVMSGDSDKIHVF
jgi:hypothetical protein